MVDEETRDKAPRPFLVFSANIGSIYHMVTETIKSHFPEEFRAELENIARKEAKNEHVIFLLSQLGNKAPQWAKVFDYGVRHIKSLQGKKDEPLASFFFLLSETKTLPDTVRDFATDAMLWCEEGEEEYLGAWRSAKNAEAYYEGKIRPVIGVMP